MENELIGSAMISQSLVQIWVNVLSVRVKFKNKVGLGGLKSFASGFSRVTES
jgi:hypothetical protein